jgi:hypothetical protein
VTDAAQEAVLIGVATVLQAVAGGGALFVPDQTSLQTSLMEKKPGLRREDAATKAGEKLAKWKVALIVVWILAIVAGIAAAVLVLST